MKFRTALMILSAMMAVSCSQKPFDDNNDDGNGESIHGNVEVSIQADRKTMLRNPLSGWVIYAPIMDDVESFWDKYDHLHSADGEVKVSDYATVLYLRGSWTDFNPEKDVYLWDDDIDVLKYPKAVSFRKLEEGAKKRGLKLAFTLKTDSRDANSFCTPEYVRQEMVAAHGGDPDKPIEDYYPANSEKKGQVHTDLGFFVFSLGSQPRYYWSPYPDDPVFQKWYEVFIRALAAEYNDLDKTMFISGLGMGLWGEYHTCIYSTLDETPRQPVFEWVTDLYVNAFNKIPVVTNYHKLVGSTKGSGGADPLTPILLESAIAKGFSMRHDAFGMKQGYGYGDWERKFIANWTNKVPVLGEGGWVQGSHDFSVDYGSVRELREGEFNEMHGAYCTMMDLRYSANVETSETYSWFNDAFDLVKRFIEEGTYRVYPDKVSFPEECVKGETVTIRHRWLNLGHAYCPTNIKQFKDRFKVAFALLDPVSGEPLKVFYDENAHPHEWIGGRTSYDFEFAVTDVPSGKYEWGVGIVDAGLSDKIAIHLGAKGNFTESGWLEFGSVIVR